MLAATDLVFRADGRALINHVSARFEPGRLHLIVGANGAGKSTLIKLLARLLRPAEGGVAYDGKDAAHWSERDLAQCRAVLSQAIEVAFSIPIRELVLMGRYSHFGARPGHGDLQVCEEVMRFFDVDAMADRSYGTLSGGEKQRVQFARVLAQISRPLEGSARYLFLDEPLTFLDIRHQIDFMEKVRGLCVTGGCRRGGHRARSGAGGPLRGSPSAAQPWPHPRRRQYDGRTHGGSSANRV
jgi:iron complex transport system ATP-binding protein